MKSTLGRSLAVVFVVILSFSSLTILDVKAQYTSNGNPFILASQIKIESPQNKTYTTNNLTLNTFQQSLFNPNSTKLSYSIDGKENTTLPFTTKRHPIYATRTYPNGTTETVISIQSPYNITGYANLPELTEGSHSITVYGEYPLNNFLGLDKNTVYFIVDAIPLEIKILSGKNKSYRTDYPLNFAIDEPTTEIFYCLDSQFNNTIPNNYTLTGLPLGLHNITVYARDLAGNLAVSETIHFNIVDPFPTTIVLASVIILSIVGVGILAYYKKRRTR